MLFCYYKAAGDNKDLSPATDDGSNVYQAIMTAVKKIDLMSDKVKSLEEHIVRQDKRIEELIASSGKESGSDNSDASRGKPSLPKPKNNITHEDSGSNDSDASKVKPSRPKSKKNRIQEEKDRQYKMLQQKLKSLDKDSRAGSGESSGSDEGLDMKAMRRKMSKKQKSKCKQRVAAVLKHAGATFPDDEFVTSSSSGTESGNSRGKYKYRKKVKSGATIKKRPVVRTELWPHTIANEEDGEEITSENISLAKFFTCFTYIMIECKGLEVKGRTALLHAVSMVMEDLYWSEARSFHNIVMVKLEQDRLDWGSDFTALAEDFIDKKVRQSMKGKGASGFSSTNRSYGYNRYNNNYNNRNFGNNNKSVGKGYGSYSKSFTGKNKTLYNSVCKQYNFGSCTYGDKCNRWHVCWTCAEAGKVGEFHRASSHDNSRAKQAEPRS